jgi:hypothetical protein
MILDHDALVVAGHGLGARLARRRVEESGRQVAVADQVRIATVGDDAGRVVRLGRHEVEGRNDALESVLLALRTGRGERGEGPNRETERAESQHLQLSSALLPAASAIPPHNSSDSPTCVMIVFGAPSGVQS